MVGSLTRMPIRRSSSRMRRWPQAGFSRLSVTMSSTQVVEPDARELHRLACAAKHLADVFPRLLGLRIGRDPVALDVPRLGL